MTEDLGTPAPAWADEATRASWRRLRLVGWVWLVVGVVALGASVVLVSRGYDHADGLRATGVEAQGVVLADPPESLRCGKVAVP
ncbi:hypothetical protein B7486_64565, partial [cyanobacterium TDX16]